MVGRSKRNRQEDLKEKKRSNSLAALLGGERGQPVDYIEVC
jgi:hypothetical protein